MGERRMGSTIWTTLWNRPKGGQDPILSTIETGFKRYAQDSWGTVEVTTCTEEKREKEDGPWCKGETPVTTTQEVTSLDAVSSSFLKVVFFIS